MDARGLFIQIQRLLDIGDLDDGGAGGEVEGGGVGGEVCAFGEELVGGGGVDGAGEEIALAQMAAERAEEVELFGGLDAFGDDLEIEILAEHQDRLDDGAALVVLAQDIYERAVDL